VVSILKNPDHSSSTTFDSSRRRFLSGSASLLTAAALAPAVIRPAHAAIGPRHLSFYHTHTGEKLALDYHDGSACIPESLAEINHFLRDFRTEAVHTIDPGLLDLLHDLKQATNTSGTFEVISGYRSPATNAKLRSTSNGVAKRSLHMQGKAIDIRMTGFDTRELHRASKALARGGVGYYQKSDFVHVDTGRVRYW
jgi:uncharacterized protein YcbK (DUF882 family)